MKNSIPDPEGRWFDSAVHEVRERDYFFIASFSVWGLWVGMGLAALWRRLAAGRGGPEAGDAQTSSASASSPIR